MFDKNSPGEAIVDNDPFSSQLIEHIKERQTWLEDQSVYPSDDGECECGVSQSIY